MDLSPGGIIAESNELPAALAPVFDADGVTLTVLGKEPPSHADLVWAAVKGSVVVGVPTFFATMSEAGDPCSSSVVGIASIAAVAVGVMGARDAFRKRRSTLDEITTTVHLGAHGIRVGAEQRRWHELSSVERAGSRLDLLCSDGSRLCIEMGGHPFGVVSSLREYIEGQVDSAAGSKGEAQAMREALRGLRGRQHSQDR